MVINGKSTPPLLLSVVEAAALCGVGKTLMWEFVAAGRVESLHLGKRRLIPRQALEDFVERERARQREGGADG